MNSANNLNYYLFADKRFYEPMDYCVVNEGDYFDFVRSQADAEWKFVRSGIWINCIYLKHTMPLQGWKIHLSATHSDSEGIFSAAAEFLMANKVTFKFLLDKKTLAITNSKGWSRGASGKFMTVYPTDPEHCKWLLEKLHSLTADFCGPYILSDMRYKDSKVLYYRYGGFRPNLRLDVNGKRIPVLVSPDGKEEADVRPPYYRLPGWVDEIFPKKNTNESGGGLNNGRYAVERSLHFSNTGGIYIAYDNIGKKRVVLKEARAHVNAFAENVDAARMLKREYDILKKVGNCGIAPEPVELFREWEHLFLAEEYLEGYITLHAFAAQNSILLEARPTEEKVKSYLEKYIAIFRKLAGIIEALHSRNIIFGDFSVNNVLVNPATLDIKIIDLEGALVEGEEEAYKLFTRGFAAVEQVKGAAPTRESDYYAFGAIMLYMLTHINGILDLKPDAGTEALQMVGRDFGIPVKLRRIINTLMHSDPAKRRGPGVLRDQKQETALRKTCAVRLSAAAPRLSRKYITDTVRSACSFIESSADYARKDRLFPADPEIFETNPLSLAHGAVGVLYTLSKLGRKPAPEMLQWVRQHEISGKNCPPGLYPGMSGIAWGLLELGDKAGAEAVFGKTFNSPLLAVSSSLYTGLAGWGMTNLKFWLATRKEIYLDNAKKAGETLLDSARNDSHGAHWPDQAGKVPIGLAHGAGGIGLFLLYLYAATGNQKYRQKAVEALDHDIAYADAFGNGNMAWAKTAGENGALYPYWEYGSAGIGIACLRYFSVLKEPKYMKLVEKIYESCATKYAIFPGRNMGMAGLGEFLLDAYAVTKDVKYLNSAHSVASGFKRFAIRSPKGVAFPGDGLARISCDYAAGMSGIILFLDRLVSGRPADFMLDELL
ncbi:MAG: class III lanthionine synthetase LanKC [Elusimicrobiales bacterium]|jgi:serine/threonine protein kinase